MTTTIDLWSLGRHRFAPDCLSRLHGAARETRRTGNRRLLDMTLHRLRLFELALVAGVVTTTVQAVERDVVGWEGARWGMNEREIREAFSSKLLVPLAGEQPGETVLSIPGYVFLGCPFDVTFRFAGARGLVQVSPAQRAFTSRLPAVWSPSLPLDITTTWTGRGQRMPGAGLS